MNAIRSVRVCFLAAALVCLLSAPLAARVTVTSMVNTPQFTILPTANFTIDDWLTNPNLWTVTVMYAREEPRGDLARLDLDYALWSNEFNPIAEGTLHLYNRYSSVGTLFTDVQPGIPYLIVNTMIREGSGYVSNDDWSDEFLDEVIRVGYLPEGQYYLKFTLNARYTDQSTETASTGENEIILEIRNPSPPELVMPDDGSTTVVTIPRFTWQRPTANTFTIGDNRTMVPIFYTLKLWKMFDETGQSLFEEEAVTRIPIWEVADLPFESVDFNPGDSREELVSGRRYCWQVQAFDGEGRSITSTNEGKSDIYEFTVQFTPPEINPPATVAPLSLTWRAARAGGAPVMYRVRIADNPEYTRAVETRGLMTNRFTYPLDAPALRNGVTYYVEVQTTDTDLVPMGTPATASFSLPPLNASLSSPVDGTSLASMTPVFTWTGNARYYTVTLFDDTRDWGYTSPAVMGTRLVYDGEPLSPGATYGWTVTPANQYGDPIGDASETWRFSSPDADRIALVSPVNESVSTILPAFSWTPPLGTPGGATYSVTVIDHDGAIVHSATTRETTYTYPRSAEPLGYAARYTWSVGVEGSGESAAQAWFLTPFITTDGETITMDDISAALRMVMGDMPEFAEFENLILAGIRDENGPVTPEELMDIMNRYRLVEVTVE